MSTTDNEAWKQAVLAHEAVGDGIRDLVARVEKNRRQMQQDRIAEMKTELHAYESNTSPHDD